MTKKHMKKKKFILTSIQRNANSNQNRDYFLAIKVERISLSNTYCWERGNVRGTATDGCVMLPAGLGEPCLYTPAVENRAILVWKAWLGGPLRESVHQMFREHLVCAGLPWGLRR